MKFLLALFRKHRDVVCYLFFGMLTTLVNYLVYLPLFNWAGLSGTASNAIAWASAVIFAYLTNKPFVFRSRDWSRETVIPEFTKFIGCRLGSGLLETACIFVLVDVLLLNGNAVKLVLSAVVVILNYIGSKAVVFRKK